MKKEFIKFLKSKRLLGKFKEELKKKRSLSNIDEYTKYQDDENNTRHYISGAFLWNNYDFNLWKDVGNQWQEHLTKLKK